MPNKGMQNPDNKPVNNDPKTNVKFTPFTAALDRSRLLRTGAQSVIKSATEGMELQEFDNSIVMPTPQNLMHVLNETATDREHHSDELEDLASRGDFIFGNSPDVTFDSIEPQDIDVNTMNTTTTNDVRLNPNVRTRTSSSLNGDENNKNRNANENDYSDDCYPSSFYKRLIYSKHAQQISNVINRATKKKGGGIKSIAVLLSSLTLLQLGILKGVTSNKVDFEQTNDDEIGKEEAAESEITWLLSGMGRWNIKMEAQAAIRSYEPTNNNIVDFKKVRVKEVMPAAQISTTSPRINVDAASEAHEIFSLNLTNKWHYKGTVIHVIILLL